MRGEQKTGTVASWVADAAVAASVALVAVAGDHLTAEPGSRPGDWWWYALFLAGAAALLLRRRRPVVALGMTAAAATVMLALDLGHEGPFLLLPLVVALFCATESGRRRPAVAAAGTVLVAFGLATLGQVTDPTEGVVGLAWATGWLAAAVVAGEVRRSRRDYLWEVESRVSEAERSRDEEARRRASDERLRIARELHDVLGHSLSLITVQAGAAAHVVDERPDKARESLAVIRETSSSALEELRETLGVLRQEGEAAPRGPTPTLDRLDELVGQMAAADVEVEVSVGGRPRPLPSPTDRAAYRILQEALTNALRHAAADRVTVHLDYRDHELFLEVADTGRGVTDETCLETGDGIAGMRQRAASLGGDLRVRGDDEGVRVRSRLPIGDGR